MNFDKIVNRKNTNSIKHDFHRQYGKPEGAIPLWVADMDFPVPEPVREALHKACGHAIFGYTEGKEDYFRAVTEWFSSMHGYNAEEEWIVKTPGITFALGMIIKAMTEPGDGIIIQTPLYPPIAKTIGINNRLVVDNPLVYESEGYSIDFDDFEEKIRKNNVRMFILCSPHNPVGRVWTSDELAKLGEICVRNKVLVLSDEIHCDLVFIGHKHVVFPTIDKSFEDISIVCTAPSKTFNLAGLQASNTFIQNEELRKRLEAEILASGYHQLGTMGIVACQAAYEHGHQWYLELMDYLSENAKFVNSFLEENIPMVKAADLQGTYLMWLDFNRLGMSQQELIEMLDRAMVWPNIGTDFSEKATGFFRFNIGTQRSVLEQAFRQLSAAINS